MKQQRILRVEVFAAAGMFPAHLVPGFYKKRGGGFL